MFELPQSVVLEDIEYPIRNQGDYRTILDCLLALGDEQLTKQERVFSALIIFYDGINSIPDILKFQDVGDAVRQMYRFINCGQDESPGAKVNYKLVDWERDSQLISSAVNTVAGKELRLEPYVHWWTFMGYYLAIGDSPFSNIVKIRSKRVKGEKLEKYERKFILENPQYFNWDARTVEQKEAEELIRQLWNNGEG